MNQPATLSRPAGDRVIAGVASGIARRFGVSATLVRVIYVLASVVSAAFPGLLVYILLWVLMPESD